LLGIYNIIPVEVRALDPSRNTSLLRFEDWDLAAEYIPGRLIGDRLHLLVTPRQLRPVPRLGKLRPNQVPVKLQRVVERPDSLLFEFGTGLSAELARSEFLGLNGTTEWTVEFPAQGLRFI
jgi:hypothetical protein